MPGVESRHGVTPPRLNQTEPKGNEAMIEWIALRVAQLTWVVIAAAWLVYVACLVVLRWWESR